MEFSELLFKYRKQEEIIHDLNRQIGDEEIIIKHPTDNFRHWDKEPMICGRARSYFEKWRKGREGE